MIFDPLAEGGAKVGGSLTCPAGIVTVCLWEVCVAGGRVRGHEENTLCRTLIHNLHLALCQNLLTRRHSRVRPSFVCICLGVSVCLLGSLASVCLSLTYTHTRTNTHRSAASHWLPCCVALCVCVCAFKRLPSRPSLKHARSQLLVVFSDQK